MLDKFRKRGKVITIGIAGAFVLGTVLTGASSFFFRKPKLGKIGRTTITKEEYDEIRAKFYQNWTQMSQGKSMDEQTLKMINNQAWEEIIRQEIYAKAMKKNGIKIDDDEIYESLMESTPEAIMNVEIFKTDGVFDKNKMIQELAENPALAANIENYMKEMLPMEELKKKIAGDVSFSDEEVKEEYVAQNDLRDAEFIFFGKDKIDSKKIKITDDEVTKYYNDNKEDFKKGPTRKIKYVKMTMAEEQVRASHILIKVADKENTELVEEKKSKADAIYQDLLKGTDFAKTAEKYSEGPSKSKGGDLGFFGKKRMAKEFEEVAFKLAEGEISEPVLTQFGWHIIKKTGYKPADSKEAFMAKAADFRSLAKSKGLDAAAKESELSTQESKGFEEEVSYVSGIGRSEALVKFAFENKIGTLSEPVEVGNNIVVAEVSYEIGDHYEDVTDSSVSKRIKSKLKREKEGELAKVEAEKFLKKNNGKDIFKRAEKAEYTVFSEEKFTKDKYLKSIGRDEDFMTALFDLEEGSTTKLFSSTRGAYIAKVTHVQKPDMDKFVEEKAELKENMIDKEANKLFNDWYKERKAELEIVDNREMFGY